MPDGLIGFGRASAYAHLPRVWHQVQRFGLLIFEGLVGKGRGPVFPGVTAFFGRLFRAISNENKATLISYLPLDYLKVKALSCLALNDLEDLSHFRQIWGLARRTLKARVHDTILRFRLSPSRTLRMMRRTKTVISGSAALKTIDACGWDANDLDFYSPKEEVQSVLSWFETHRYRIVRSCKSYSLYPPAACDPPGRRYTTPEVAFVQLGANNCIETVFTLQHELSGDKINVIQSKSSSAVAPIAFFHSTIVMNFISSDTVVCGYPSLTLRGQGLMNAQTMPPLRAVKQEVSAVAKYQRRGYSFVQGRNEDPTFNPADPHRNRSWRDQYSLRMRFRRGYRGGANSGTVGDGEWKVSYREWYRDNGFIEYPAQFLAEEREARGRVLYRLQLPRPTGTTALIRSAVGYVFACREVVEGVVVAPGNRPDIAPKSGDLNTGHATNWLCAHPLRNHELVSILGPSSYIPHGGCQITQLQPLPSSQPLNDTGSNQLPAADETTDAPHLTSFTGPHPHRDQFVGQPYPHPVGFGYESINWERHDSEDLAPLNPLSTNPRGPGTLSPQIPIREESVLPYCQPSRSHQLPTPPESPAPNSSPHQIPWLDAHFIFEDRAMDDCQSVSTYYDSSTTLAIGASQEAVLGSILSLREAIRELSQSARQLYLAIETLSQTLPTLPR
ncbi:hypothetical protein FA13DRAFT_1714959 [Coprinellus micaceus]|uniref:Uncharacterized protein n=1 Tax=Coprinellus micaceus TaxID=71717 RepID=A0A4Y7SQA3_COPMI|nr:hypothetical protein FA13DRAFT_1714959 [Coprinellus micaceus]